jgi:lysozyme
VRKINAAGLALVRAFEGCRLLAYDDLDPDRALAPGDRLKGTLTIGHGHTGPDVSIGQRITGVEAEALLRADLAEAEQGVARLVKLPQGDNAFAALVSLAFNIGLDNFRRSTLLRKLNGGDRLGASAEFARWNKAGGKVLAGLTRRRAAEAALFLAPDAPPDAPSLRERPTATPDGVSTDPALGKAIAVGGSLAAGSATVIDQAFRAGAGLPSWVVLAAAGLGLAAAAFLLWRRWR